jgi:hypothetical protein
MPLWFRGKHFNGRWRESEYVHSLDLPKLMAVRVAFTAKLDAFRAWAAEHTPQHPWWFGLTLNDMSWDTLREAGIDLHAETPTLVYASFQRIQVAEGTWESGPGKWRTLASTLPQDANTRGCQ